MFSVFEQTEEGFLLEAISVSRTFILGSHVHQALQNVSLKLERNAFTAIAGPSGSGKSTLLNILGCLERPTSGDVKVEGISTRDMSVPELAKFRAEKLGFIFQTFNLIPTLNALENVEYPLLLTGVHSKERIERAQEALNKVGLENFYKNRPSQLSGGQRQRVAIARAIVKKPLLVLADEPTANLDQKTSCEILDLMQELNSQEQITFLLSSHDPLVLKRTHRVIHLVDGKQTQDNELLNVA